MASLQKNVSSQNITFGLVSATTFGAVTGATVTAHITKDNGTQASGAGTFTEKGSGQYNYTPTQAETNATSVGFLFTATGAIPVNLDFHTDPANFLSLAIDGTGNVAVQSNVKKNTAKTGFMFVMTDSSAHAPKTGLTVTCNVNLDGAGWVASTNAVSELTNGWYKIDLAAADTNGNHVAMRFTATGADDLNVEYVTTP